MNALEWIQSDLGQVSLTRAVLRGSSNQTRQHFVQQSLNETIKNLITEKAEEATLLRLYRAVRAMARWRLGHLELSQEVKDLGKSAEFLKRHVARGQEGTRSA